jgi:hypothetical protein
MGELALSNLPEVNHSAKALFTQPSFLNPVGPRELENKTGLGDNCLNERRKSR